MRIFTAILLTTSLSLALSEVARAGDTGLTDTLEIVKKADEAAKAVKAVQYEVTFEGTGAAKDRVGKFTGTYTLMGWADRGPEKFRAKIKGTRPGSSDVHDIEGGGNGDEFFLVDHTHKKAYQDMDTEVMGSGGRMIMAGLMAEFVYTTPFSDEIKAKNCELKGTKTVGGEPCYEVYVLYENDQEAVWCFSKKDFLPRSRLDMFKAPDGQNAGQLKTISKLVVDPKINPSTFKLKMPAGYEKVDDYAP
jgi:hypothetical protein